MAELRPPPPKPPRPPAEPPASPRGSRKIKFPISDQSLRLDLADKQAEHFGIESRLVRERKAK